MPRISSEQICVLYEMALIVLVLFVYLLTVTYGLPTHSDRATSLAVDDSISTNLMEHACKDLTFEACVDRYGVLEIKRKNQLLKDLVEEGIVEAAVAEVQASTGLYGEYMTSGLLLTLGDNEKSTAASASGLTKHLKNQKRQKPPIHHFFRTCDRYRCSNIRSSSKSRHHTTADQSILDNSTSETLQLSVPSSHICSTASSRS